MLTSESLAGSTGKSTDTPVSSCVADSETRNAPAANRGASLNPSGAALLKGRDEQTPNSDGRGPFREYRTPE
jgi:hypothetical protein